MKKQFRIFVLLISVCALPACISSRAYVDPQYHRASYETIKRLSEPQSVKLDVQFQRNGKPLPAVNAEVRGHVERTLRATGVFIPATDAPTLISVTANNIADIAAARAKGFGTGLTFGAAGSMVDDNYEFTCSFQDASHSVSNFSYRHAIHTTIGNAAGPEGLAPTTLADAFGRVVEDVMLNFVKDLQDKGLLVR